MTDLERAKIPAAAAIGAATALWASVPAAMQVLLLLMAIDFVSGLLAGWSARAIDSSVGTRGLVKKALIWCVIAAAAVAQPSLGDVPAATGLAGFFSVIEVISVVENAGRAGVKLPRALTAAMAKLQGTLELEAPPRG